MPPPGKLEEPIHTRVDVWRLAWRRYEEICAEWYAVCIQFSNDGGMTWSRTGEEVDGKTQPLAVNAFVTITISTLTILFYT